MRDKVEVTQADRIAAAKWLASAGADNWGLCDDVLIGKADDYPSVQAFAAHRAAILAELETPSVEMVESVEDCGPIGCCSISDKAATEIIQAIAAHLKAR